MVSLTSLPLSLPLGYCIPRAVVTDEQEPSEVTTHGCDRPFAPENAQFSETAAPTSAMAAEEGQRRWYTTNNLKLPVVEVEAKSCLERLLKTQPPSNAIPDLRIPRREQLEADAEDPEK